jgi:hypothetical protein
MALIEKFHVVAAVKAVAAGQNIKEGQLVSLNSSGAVVLQNGTNKVPYGVAGDTKNTASYLPGVASGWQNRSSDYFDETKASGKMTVYHSGGEFATDQFTSNTAGSTPYAALYAYNGLFHSVTDVQDSGVVAYLTAAAAAYPSGVPGVDTTSYDATTYVGDQAMGGMIDSPAGSTYNNTYIEFKLVI